MKARRLPVRWAAIMLAVLVLPLAASAAPMLAKGARFPEWKLVDQAGKSVSSAELAGKTYLLWFYPKAMTAG
ncbi:MAG: AhpC/TSA family [Candidatus Binatota bacterium]|nr:AhpC/TSA family [Candidatus Binatota bacterium]